MRNYMKDVILGGIAIVIFSHSFVEAYLFNQYDVTRNLIFLILYGFQWRIYQSIIILLFVWIALLTFAYIPYKGKVRLIQKFRGLPKELFISAGWIITFWLLFVVTPLPFLEYRTPECSHMNMACFTWKAMQDMIGNETEVFIMNRGKASYGGYSMDSKYRGRIMNRYNFNYVKLDNDEYVVFDTDDFLVTRVYGNDEEIPLLEVTRYKHTGLIKSVREVTQ